MVTEDGNCPLPFFNMGLRWQLTAILKWLKNEKYQNQKQLNTIVKRSVCFGDLYVAFL